MLSNACGRTRPVRRFLTSPRTNSPLECMAVINARPMTLRIEEEQNEALLLDPRILVLLSASAAHSSAAFRPARREEPFQESRSRRQSGWCPGELSARRDDTQEGVGEGIPSRHPSSVLIYVCVIALASRRYNGDLKTEKKNHAALQAVHNKQKIERDRKKKVPARPV
jgi:hypothetical protein